MGGMMSTMGSGTVFNFVTNSYNIYSAEKQAER